MKRSGKFLIGVLVVLVVLVAAATLVGVTRAPAQPGGMASESDIQVGYATSPVPLDLQGKNRALVALGSYNVNAQGGCNDCHTNPPYAPGGDPYLGEPMQINAEHYLAGGMAFGPFTSRNLTPDENGLPAGLTLDEFVYVMRTGTDIDQEHPMISPLLQVMPWPIYGKMTKHDLTAIYEFLRSIPHAEPAPPPPPG